MPRSVSDIKVTHRPDGEGFRRIALEWMDESGGLQTRIYCGYTANKIFGDLETSTALGEDAREGFLLGLVRGISTEALI